MNYPSGLNSRDWRHIEGDDLLDRNEEIAHRLPRSQDPCQCGHALSGHEKGRVRRCRSCRCAGYEARA